MNSGYVTQDMINANKKESSNLFGFMMLSLSLITLIISYLNNLRIINWLKINEFKDTSNGFSFKTDTPAYMYTPNIDINSSYTGFYYTLNLIILIASMILIFFIIYSIYFLIINKKIKFILITLLIIMSVGCIPILFANDVINGYLSVEKIGAVDRHIIFSLLYVPVHYIRNPIFLVSTIILLTTKLGSKIRQ